MTSDEGVNFTRAIVRPPSSTFAEGITTAALGAPDVALARAQHANYCRALQRLGLTLLPLPEDPAHPDSTFVEDTAVITPSGAIVTRPGAASRAGEVLAIRETLEREYPALAQITAPGTLDGGDICHAGRQFLIGLSQRTNDEGAQQLTHWLGRFGYTATTIDIRGDSALLHLKSGLSWLGRGCIVVAESLAGHPALRHYRSIVVESIEAYAANCVRVNTAVLIAAGYSNIAKRVAALGHEVVSLDVSEFAKMDGGLSCLSLRIP